MTLMPIPITMPSSSGSTKQQMKAAIPGIKSVSEKVKKI